MTNRPFNLLTILIALAHRCIALLGLIFQHFPTNGFPNLKTDSSPKPCARPDRPAVRTAVWLVAFSATVLFALTMPSFATQEPGYTLVRELEGAEVRDYLAYAAAEVVVPGPATEAGNQAFPILAGYIFRNNKGERKFAMTAPVTQAAVPVKMAMTAPVTQVAAPGGFLVQF